MWATIGLMAIITPSTVVVVMCQIDAPSDTPARSCAEAWPAIITATTDKPTVANCPIRIGQASRHRAPASCRTRAARVGFAVATAMVGVMSTGLSGRA